MKEMPEIPVEQGPDSSAVDAAIETVRAMIQEKDRRYAAVEEAEGDEKEALWQDYCAYAKQTDAALEEALAAIGAFYEAEAARDPEQRLPAGPYGIAISYEHRDGTRKTTKSLVHLWSANRRADLLQGARSDISMVGLHNFGLRREKNLPAGVDYVLTSTEDPSVQVSSKCWVDEGGHIVGVRKKG